MNIHYTGFYFLKDLGLASERNFQWAFVYLTKVN